MVSKKEKLGFDRLKKRQKQEDDVFHLIDVLKQQLPVVFDDFGLEHLSFGLADYPIDDSTDMKYTISVKYKRGEQQFEDTLEIGSFSYVPSVARYTKKLEEILVEKGFEKIEPVLNKLFKDLGIETFAFLSVNQKTGKLCSPGAPGFFNEEKKMYCNGFDCGNSFYNIDSMVKHYARLYETYGISSQGFLCKTMLGRTEGFLSLTINGTNYELRRASYNKKKNIFYVEFKLDKPDAEVQKMPVDEFREHIGLKR